MRTSPLAQMAHAPCVIHHVASDGDARDEYGNIVPEATTTKTTCYRWQQSRSEVGLDNIERERWTAIFFDVAIALDANDMVTVDGGDYQVIGMPWPVIHPVTGKVDHIESTIERRR